MQIKHFAGDAVVLTDGQLQHRCIASAAPRWKA
jgi:hypothetical protein